MKCDDDGGDCEPEEGMQPGAASPVELEHVTLVCGGLAHLHHVDGVLEVAHVLAVRCDVEDRRQGLSQLYRELDGVRPEFDWRV